jgi:hypothetical protein
MSFHYTVSFSLRFKNGLSSAQIGALQYLLNDNGRAPELLPNHAFFKSGIPDGALLWRSYKGFAPGSWRSEFWQGANVPGMPGGGEVYCGVNLLLPSQKMESALDLLPMLCWLATMSDTIGYVGAASCEDDGVGMPLFLLFVDAGNLRIAGLPKEIVMESAEGLSG